MSARSGPAGPAPVEGGATEVFVHERASATPRAEARPPRERRERKAAPAKAAMPLRDAQLWFARVMTSDDLDATSEDEALGVLTAGPRMSALDRIGVYHHAYRARLVECLADDYPALQHALGDDAFDALARGYVARHSSRSPNLNAYGRYMAAFCMEWDGAGRFAADLARLEWALVEVLHAREADRLVLAELQAVPMEQWEAARLPPSATVRLLRFAHPVNAYYQAWRTGGAPEVPAPAPSATAAYRRELTLWRMDLTPAMAALLERLFAGDTLGEALTVIERAAETPEALAEAEHNVMVWFREWVAGGLFARVIVASPP